MADFLTETSTILDNVDRLQVHGVTEELRALRERKGRLFIIGNGGGAGHASHAAADFRKIGRIESYAWGDNASDMTAYINDLSWEVAVSSWLEDSRFGTNDCLMVFTVGGSSDKVSANLRWAMSYAKGASIVGFVGADGGELARYGTAIVRIPSTSTPQVEGIQAVLWHGIVTAL